MQLGPGALLVRLPRMHRFVLWSFAGFAAFMAMGLSGAWARGIAAVVAVALVVVARRAAAWRPWLDADGWHQGRTTVSWDQVGVLALNVHSPGHGRLFLRDGTSRSMWEGVSTSGPAGWFGAEEAVARLAHQVAHQVGARPVPVVLVDRKADQRRVLDPRCAECLTWLEAAA